MRGPFIWQHFNVDSLGCCKLNETRFSASRTQLRKARIIFRSSVQKIGHLPALRAPGGASAWNRTRTPLPDNLQRWLNGRACVSKVELRDIRFLSRLMSVG